MAMKVVDVHWKFGVTASTSEKSMEACLDVGVASSVEGASPHASRHGTRPRPRDAPPLAELFEDATLGRKVPSGKDVLQLERLLERLKAIRGTNSHTLDSKTD
ncbi:Protein of unknown function [Gryllus bimaculatus]|nr:Protein of unknown function [Gryllus bimaculatus]